MKKNNKIFSFFETTIIIFSTSIVMFLLGSILIYKHLGGNDYSVIANDKNLQKFIFVYNDLLKDYYEDLNTDALIDGAIKGLYANVEDPYTTYLDSDSANALSNSLEGDYKGIGIRLMHLENGENKIVEIFKGSPAENSGLLVNDNILKINDKSIEKMDLNKISDLIKNSPNGITKILVKRDKDELSFEVKIKKLLVPSVESQILEKEDKKIGYMKIKVFNSTVDKQVQKALIGFDEKKIESLIIDLRNNTGGYLQMAKNISEMFIEKGKIIYSLQNKNSKKDYIDTTDEKRNYKIVILINSGSASASEILTSSLKYSYGATIMGTNSYGKGKVQEKATLKDGTTLKYTTAKWLTPNGNCIDGKGIKPDIEVEFDKDEYDKNNIYSDNQINSALNKLAEN